jgi:hypothetical protein
MITQLKFVGIPTRDQSRALKFYTEQLGFEVPLISLLATSSAGSNFA